MKKILVANYIVLGIQILLVIGVLLYSNFEAKGGMEDLGLAYTALHALCFLEMAIVIFRMHPINLQNNAVVGLSATNNKFTCY